MSKIEINAYIKKCPFCGGEATLWRKEGKWGPLIMVQCDTCSAVSKCFNYYEQKGVNWTESMASERAIAAWNRRIDDVKET